MVDLVADAPPRVGDSVMVWGQRGTIVLLRYGYATLDADDDIRVQVPIDALRWMADRQTWVVVHDDPPEPKWLHEDPAFVEPAP